MPYRNIRMNAIFPCRILQNPYYIADFFFNRRREANYREERKKCCKQKEENLHEVLFARIEYPLILDDIFSYLGGFSFQEKVEQEIKTDAKAGVTYAKYKLQSKKLSIQNLLCSKTDLWGEYEICLDSEKYKALLRALTFFDSSKEQVSIYDGWLERFVSFFHIAGKRRKKGFLMNTLRLERKLLNLSILKMADGILFLSVVYMHCLLPKSISL